MTPARGRLRPGRGFHVGANTWYLVAAGRSIGVLKVRHGQIQEIGIADRKPCGRAPAAHEPGLTAPRSGSARSRRHAAATASERVRTPSFLRIAET